MSDQHAVTDRPITPVLRRDKGSHRATATPSSQSREERRAEAANEMHRGYYGVSPSDFVHRLLGQDLERIIASLKNNPDMSALEHQFSQSIASGMGETAVLRAIAECSADTNDLFPRDLPIYSTDKHQVTVHTLSLKPDGMAYTLRDPIGSPPRDTQRADFAHAVLAIECKTKNTADPWVRPPVSSKGSAQLDDPSPGSTSSSKTTGSETTTSVTSTSTSTSGVLHTVARDQSHGQTIDYATGLFLGAKRTNAFVIFLADTYARITRWDHATTVVSDPIDLRTDTFTFAALLHCIVNSSSHMLGWDQTVEPLAASGKDKDMAAQVRRDLKDKYGQNSGFEHYELYRRYISAFDGPLERHYVQGEEGTIEVITPAQPTFRSSTITGRFSQGTPAYVVATKSMGYLKRSWHPTTSDSQLHLEGWTYKRLAKAGVSHIPTILGAGTTIRDEVRDIWHRSINHYASGWSWTSDRDADQVRELVQYELLMRECGIPIEEVRSSKDVVMSLLCAVIALIEALEKAGILHRDISVGNVLFYPGGALLADWHLSLLVRHIEGLGDEKPHGTASQPYRSGTREYMALRLMTNNTHVHAIADDLESFLWVLVWLIVRFRNSGSVDDRRRRLRFLFNFDASPQAEDIGHRYMLFVPTLYKLPAIATNGPLTRLCGKLITLFAQRYPSSNDAPASIAPADVLALFEEASKAKDWPAMNEDQYLDAIAPAQSKSSSSRKSSFRKSSSQKPPSRKSSQSSALLVPIAE